MKKHLFSLFLLLISTSSFLIFNSCAEYVDGDISQQSQSQGSVEIKFLNGPDQNKVIKSTGNGAVIGTKRTINDKFAVYQIVGTFQNLGFGCQVSKESGEDILEINNIYFTLNMTETYISADDTTGNVKITDIVLTQSYPEVGAQIMNGKVTFKGKFTKENHSTGVEEEILIEGKAIF